MIVKTASVGAHWENESGSKHIFIASWLELAVEGRGIVLNKGRMGFPVKDPAAIANFEIIVILTVVRSKINFGIF